MLLSYNDCRALYSKTLGLTPIFFEQELIYSNHLPHLLENSGLNAHLFRIKFAMFR